MDHINQRHSLNPDFVDDRDDTIAGNDMTLKMAQL